MKLACIGYLLHWLSFLAFALLRPALPCLAFIERWLALLEGRGILPPPFTLCSIFRTLSPSRL